MTPRYLNSVTRFIADPITVYRTKRNSLSLEQCLNLLPCQHALWRWADRCSFEDSCEHQETLWSSPDCKHLESRKQPCNIASQLSFLYQLSFCHGTRAVISPPTLTRFWYRRAYHVFNVFKGAVRLKALFFVDFDPFSSISSQDSIQSKNDSIKLQSLIQ